MTASVAGALGTLHQAPALHGSLARTLAEASVYHHLTSGNSLYVLHAGDQERKKLATLLR